MNARSLRWMALAAAAGTLLGGCGYNNLQRQDENVKAAWSEVVNQYQRRVELVPNLVKTVADVAPQQALIGVTEARARLSSTLVSADILNNPGAFVRYQAAQQQLTQSLENLLAVAHGHPELESNETFRDLRGQLQSRESRIAQARDRYSAAVRQYNINVGTFPSSFTAKLLDFHVRPNLTIDDGRAAAAPVADPGEAGPTGGQSGGQTGGQSGSAPALHPAQSQPEPAAARPPAEPAPAAE